MSIFSKLLAIHRFKMRIPNKKIKTLPILIFYRKMCQKQTPIHYCFGLESIIWLPFFTVVELVDLKRFPLRQNNHPIKRMESLKTNITVFFLYFVIFEKIRHKNLRALLQADNVGVRGQYHPHNRVIPCFFIVVFKPYIISHNPQIFKLINLWHFPEILC